MPTSESKSAKNLLARLLGLALRNKVYWIIPLGLLLLLAALMSLGSEPSAPFVYKLF